MRTFTRQVVASKLETFRTSAIKRAWSIFTSLGAQRLSALPTFIDICSVPNDFR